MLFNVAALDIYDFFNPVKNHTHTKKWSVKRFRRKNVRKKTLSFFSKI